jgi:Xaa-Pro dipeptidase
MRSRVRQPRHRGMGVHEALVALLGLHLGRSLSAVSLLCLLAASGGPLRAAEESGENPWLRIRHERIRTLLPRAMERVGVDAWLVICRENANDPLALHVGGENAGGTAVFLFLRDNGAVRSVAFSPVGEATALKDVGLHDEVVVLERGQDAIAAAARALRKLDPSSVAVNSSAAPAADGLSFTQHRTLVRALGPELEGRLFSSQGLVEEWLSIKLPEEIEIMREAALLTERLQREAYATVVPGRTRDSDLARFLEERMRELGVEDAWAPDQNPNVNSGPDRGHSHATDRVIRAGDFIQTDFGVKVHGVWCTDIQRFAYVLGPGQTAPPEEALERWEKSKRGSRTAFGAMRPGVRGYDVDAVQRAWMKQAGSEPVPWGTGHPVGYWAHDMGPALSGAQRPGQPSGASLRLLEPGQVFAFDGFFSWPLANGGTKTLSVEEMAVITESSAELLIPPQEDLILVHSRP